MFAELVDGRGCLGLKVAADGRERQELWEQLKHPARLEQHVLGDELHHAGGV